MDPASGNPVIVYSGRYGRSDHFWFTMAHEIGHVLNDLNGPIVVDEAETMADDAARSTLHILQILAMFGKNAPKISRAEILNCAWRLNVSPAVVVGVLHYYKRLDYSKMTDLTPSVLSTLAPWSGVEAMVAPYSGSKRDSVSGAVPHTA
jgi:HTH-type transcriptional regulator/antitoxin HigA